MARSPIKTTEGISVTKSPSEIDPLVIDRAHAADIVALAKRLGARLKPVRARAWKWMGPCPGCGGTDRFSVNPEKRIFNCRRGGGGDTIAMVRHVRGVDFIEAIEFITGEECVKSPTGEDSDKPAKSPTSSDADKSDGRALWLWRQRRPIVDGSPPWTYLRQARGFIGTLPATLGYLPRPATATRLP
jgi:hypothetical protein